MRSREVTVGILDLGAAIEYSSEKTSSSCTLAEFLAPVGGITVPLPKNGFPVLYADDLRFIELREDESGNQIALDAVPLAQPDVHPFDEIRGNATPSAAMCLGPVL